MLLRVTATFLICTQDARVCLLRANTADQMLDIVFPAFPKLGVKLEDVVLVNFAMWMNTCAPATLSCLHSLLL